MASLSVYERSYSHCHKNMTGIRILYMIYHLALSYIYFYFSFQLREYDKQLNVSN